VRQFRLFSILPKGLKGVGDLAAVGAVVERGRAA
jgi:hypothetical protein